MFVDRLIIQDAHTLSKSVADKIRGEFFPDNILEASYRRTRSFTVGVRKHSDNYASNSSIEQNSIFDPKTFRKFTAKPLLGAPKLKQFFDTHIDKHNHLNDLESFAVYLHNGKVLINQKAFKTGFDLKKFKRSYR